MFYAKSETGETIFTHTAELQRRYDKLKRDYGHLLPNDKLWELLDIAVKYHDVGKAYGYFQMIICRAMKLITVKHPGPPILHNYLSPFFVPLSKFDLTPDERKIVIQAIAYHHERNEEFNADLIEEVYEKELIPLLPVVSEHMGMDMNDGHENIQRLYRYMDRNNRIDSHIHNKSLYYLYVMVKGLLHRLDHAASARVEIECDADIDLAKLTEDFLTQKTDSNKNVLRDLQVFAKLYQDHNLIIIAQTGMGKTEAALLWAGKKKTFFTLPLRVSLNALHNRIYREMGYKGAGLLHSSSASYLNERLEEDWEVIHDQSRHLSSKLLFTTIDQILKFPVKFKGYEKYYATMAYSAVVIDEIQAYEPKIAAFLLKALEMIHKIGGRFMIMTATLPQLYLDYLKDRRILIEGQDYLLRTYVNDQRRHRISLESKPIDENLDVIIESGKTKKVLVIVNTVKRAVELFDQLELYGARILHSMYVQKHRSQLEQAIKDFDENRAEPGIWITTQLVEASIDIDFDELHTEAASLDSLFQRFGRCYRRRELDHDHPNVWIYTENVSGKGYIYSHWIVDEGLRLLEEFDGKVMEEPYKVDLVKRLYSRQALEGTDYLTEFDQAIKELDSILEYELDEQQAQKLLRDIQTVQVIPRSVYDAHEYLFEQLSRETSPDRRQQLRREIEQCTVSIRDYLLRGNPGLASPHGHKARRKDGSEYPILPYIQILNADYCFDEDSLSGAGVAIKSSISQFI